MLLSLHFCLDITSPRRKQASPTGSYGMLTLMRFCGLGNYL